MVQRTRHAMYYNVKIRRVHETIVDGNRNKYFIFLYVCSRACGWGHAWACVRPCVCGSMDVGARARACACARVSLLIQYAQARATLSASSLAPQYFLTLYHKRRDFRKKVTEYKMCAFVASTRFFRNISHSKKKSARYCHKCEKFSCKVPSFLSGFN
jgi:hypothetical protein